MSYTIEREAPVTFFSDAIGLDFEDIPAAFDVNVEFYDDELPGAWGVGATFKHVMFGDMKITREMLVQWIGENAVQSIEFDADTGFAARMEADVQWAAE